VLPLDDRLLGRVNAATAGRPDLMAGRNSLTAHQGHKATACGREHGAVRVRLRPRGVGMIDLAVSDERVKV
jgi:hypothetical protein